MPQIIEFVSHGERLAERALPSAAPPRGKARKGILYTLIEVSGEQAERVADELGQEIAEAFYRDNAGSVTSSLLRAVRRLNDSLFEENQRSIQAERSFGTIVCAVVRDSDVYLALVGSGTAYLVGDGPTQRIGPSEDESGQSNGPLGQTEDVRVEMFHRSLDPAGVIILATSGLADLLDQAIAQVSAIPPDRAVPLVRFLNSRRKVPFRALAIDFGIDDSEPTGAVASSAPRISRLPFGLPSIRRADPGSATPSPSVRRSDAPPPEEDGLVNDKPIARPSIRPRLPTRPIERRVIAQPRPEANPGSGPFSDDALSEPTETGEVLRRVSVPPRLGASAARTPPGLRSGYAFDPKPSVEHYATLGNWPSDGSDRRRNGVLGSMARLVSGVEVSSRAWFGLGLLVIFLFGIFLAQVPLRWIQNGATYANTVSRLAQAEQQERAALAQTNLLKRRQQLEEARRLVLEAEALGPGNTAVATAVARIQREYQSATGLVVLPEATRLVTLPSSGDRMILRGLDLYVLDRVGSRIYKYLLNSAGTAIQPHADPTLVHKGDRIGTRTVGDLTQIAWMPAGGSRTNPALLILDRAGYLIQYDSVHGLSLLALGAPNAWASVTAIDGLDGNLYALSPASRLLAWYPPQTTGYDGPAYNYFAPTTEVDLSDSAGFAVSDGLYLVSASGRIQKFDGGKPVDFAGPPATLAPRHPSGLAIGGGSVFVGDPTNARIVQIGKNGTYQQTLGEGTSDAIFSQIRDLAVSEDGRALYVLTERAIDRFELPSSVP